MKRLLAVLALMPLLAACSAVMSDRQLFTEKDRAAWRAKPGVWALVDPSKKDCATPKSVRYASWPECAIPAIVRTDVLILPKSGSLEKEGRFPYLLVEGDPLILQLKGPDDLEPDEPGYAYMAVRPTRPDGSQATMIFPDCPPADAPPIPGLEKKGNDCIAASAAAVRAAASRPDAETAPAYWIGKER